MYRFRDGLLEVFLAHPGGPFFKSKDAGHWTIPKGEVEGKETLLETALREFKEEVGIDPAGDFIELGWIQQKGGKIVHGWGFEGEWKDGHDVQSVTFPMEWPPGSGRVQRFPEVDRVGFFDLVSAQCKIKPAQKPFIDRLVTWLNLRHS